VIEKTCVVTAENIEARQLIAIAVFLNLLSSALRQRSYFVFSQFQVDKRIEFPHDRVVRYVLISEKPNTIDPA
jgi:hypothetical protein